jgi:YbbR domain-containing protein
MSLRDRLRHNLGLKIVSLVTALVIWGTVHNQADPLMLRQHEVAVQAVNVPPDLAVAGIEPTRVTVALYGRRSALDRLQYAEFAMTADVAGSGTGTASLQLKPSNLPTGLEIRHLSNRVAKVTLDVVVTATRPVFVQTRGEPAPGFMVAGNQVRPHEVTIRGPSTEVRRVARVIAAVDISGRNDTAPSMVDLMPVDAGSVMLAAVKMDPPQAAVTVQMRQVNSRTVPVAPVITKVPAGYEVASVTVRPVVVTITGSARSLAEVQAVQTAALDLTAEPGKTRYTVSLKPPGGVTVLGASSVQVTISLRKASGAPATETPAPSAPATGQPPSPPPAPGTETPPAPAGKPADKQPAGGAGGGSAQPAKPGAAAPTPTPRAGAPTTPARGGGAPPPPAGAPR